MIRKILLAGLIFSNAWCDFSVVEEKETELVKSILPKTKIEKVKKAGFGGFYKAYLQNGTILYVLPQKRIIFAGNVFTNKGFNITANDVQSWKDKLLDRLLKKSSKSELIKEAIKVSYGNNGFYEFVIFTDPQCPFCNRVEDYFKENNSTVYYNFFPLKRIHKNAEKLSLQALSSGDLKSTLKLFKTNPDDINITITDDARKKLKKMIKVAEKFKIQGTPKIFVVEKDSDKVVDVFSGADKDKVLKYSVKGKIDDK